MFIHKFSYVNVLTCVLNYICYDRYNTMKLRFIVSLLISVIWISVSVAQIMPPPNSGGGGGGSPGGTGGQVQYNNFGSFGGFTVGGDCTLNTSTGNEVCTKTNGVAFAPSATTDTTNVSNIPGAAPLASPALTGTPTAPTPTATDNTTKIATTAYVKSNQAFPNLGPLTSGTYIAMFGANTTTAATASTIKLGLIYIPAGSVSIKNVTIRFTVAPSPAFNLEICAYNYIGAGGIGSLVLDSTAFASGTAVATITQTLGSPVLLPEGAYWVGVMLSATATGTLAGISPSLPIPTNYATGAVANFDFYSVAGISVGSVGTSNCPTPASLGTSGSTTSGYNVAFGG